MSRAVRARDADPAVGMYFAFPPCGPQRTAGEVLAEAASEVLPRHPMAKLVPVALAGVGVLESVQALPAPLGLARE